MENFDNLVPGDSKERVALEMAKFIFEKIVLFDTANEKPLARKAYFFKLYAECLAVVSQNSSYEKRATEEAEALHRQSA
jgi:hypothetical protein